MGSKSKILYCVLWDELSNLAVVFWIDPHVVVNTD